MIHLLFKRLLKTFSGCFRKSELTVQGGYAEIWRIAWPLVILSASNTIMMLTNRVFLAWNSPEEIAAALHVPKGTVSARMTRGRQKLKTWMEEEL